jgi:serine/threonine protein kinase
MPSFLQGSQRLGWGCQGTVYRISTSVWNAVRPPGSKTTSHPTVALKELECPTARHEIEMHTKAAECTDGVPKIYGSFTRGDKTYIGMEDLSDYDALNISTMSISTYARIVLIVRKLHACGIAHGDLHAGNVLVKGTRVKLIDFGSAFTTSPDNDMNTGSLRGLAYSKLEDIVDRKDLDEFKQWIKKAPYASVRDAMLFAIKDAWVAGVSYVVKSGAFKDQYLSHDMIRYADRNDDIARILTKGGLL